MRCLRYIAVALFALFATDAMAWTAEVNRAVLMFAEENLSNRAKREVEALLGAPLTTIEFEKRGKNQTRLDVNGKSVTTDENDAVVLLEKAIATLKNESVTGEERREALRLAIEMTVDIHCLSNIFIDKHLEKNFTFRAHNSMQIGFRYYSAKKFDWQNLWHNEYHKRHGVFSAEMYLHDWKIATEGMAKGYKKEPVAPRKWAEQSGERAFVALKILQPEVVVENVELAKLEMLNDLALYDAGFHLASTINNMFK